MPCCFTALSHFLNQFWFIMRDGMTMNSCATGGCIEQIMSFFKHYMSPSWHYCDVMAKQNKTRQWALGESFHFTKCCLQNVSHFLPVSVCLLDVAIDMMYIPLGLLLVSLMRCFFANCLQVAVFTDPFQILFANTLGQNLAWVWWKMTIVPCWICVLPPWF